MNRSLLCCEVKGLYFVPCQDEVQLSEKEPVPHVFLSLCRSDGPNRSVFCVCTAAMIIICTLLKRPGSRTIGLPVVTRACLLLGPPFISHVMRITSLPRMPLGLVVCVSGSTLHL